MVDIETKKVALKKRTFKQGLRRNEIRFRFLCVRVEFFSQSKLAVEWRPLKMK